MEKIRRIGIVGAGTIGTAWAVVHAAAGNHVALYDPDPDRLPLALAEIADRLAALGAAGLKVDRNALSKVQTVSDLAGMAQGATLVQECAPEDLALKQRLFAELDELTDDGIPLASSTSFLPASKFAGALRNRQRCLVIHPGNPPFLLRVAEIVPAPFTSEAIVGACMATLTDAGITPIRLGGEIDGFVFNRLQGAVLREAYCLVRDGIASVHDIDAIVRDGLALRWSVVGPFESVDLNTRGGIAAHARRMGPHYGRMAEMRGSDNPWHDQDLQAQVGLERRRALPLAGWQARADWRDAEIMARLAGSKAKDGT